MAKSRYDELLTTLQAQGWSQAEVDNYVANFNGIYEEICRSIKEKSQKNGKSGLEQNEIFAKLRRDVKYQMAAVAIESVNEGKPFTMYTDSLKGPQGDLKVALNRVGYLKNYIPGLIGVKIPLANKSSSAIQSEDKYAVGPKQLFCALDRTGVMDMQDYYFYLCEYADEMCRTGGYQPVITEQALPMFDSLAEPALRKKMESEGKEYPKDFKEYFGRYKYSKVKFLETVVDKMQTEGTFAFAFKDHAPIGDFEEALVGTMFETKRPKGKDPVIMLTDRAPLSHLPEVVENIMPDSSYKDKDRFCGTSALFLTRAGLDLYGYREKVVETAVGKKVKGSTKMTFPLFENPETNSMLSLYYSDSEQYLIAQKYRDISMGKYRKPIFKGFCTRPTAETVEAFTASPVVENIKKVEPKTFVYIPSGIVPAYKPVKAQFHKAEDKEAFVEEHAHAQENLALSYLQHTVGSDLNGVEYHFAELSKVATAHLLDEIPGISDAKIAIYNHKLREHLYTLARERIETTGKVEFGFGKKGPTGDLKVALDNAHHEYAEMYPATPKIDYSHMKGFNMGQSYEEMDSPRHPTGNMTIESDGKVVIKENDNSPSQTQDDGRVQ